MSSSSAAADSLVIPPGEAYKPEGAKTNRPLGALSCQKYRKPVKRKNWPAALLDILLCCVVFYIDIILNDYTYTTAAIEELSLTAKISF